jgi:predicted phosphodiesterase
MRLGIFSDVHANIEALSAVMEGFRHERLDKYFCLGDVVGYGASPNECCDIVRRMAEVTILGNHDAAVAGRMDYSYYYEAARHALDTHAAMLTRENMEWLKTLPYKHRVEGTGVDLCLC